MDLSPPLPSSASRDSSATGPQIRSRVTVVCAECKRLKLKCDRNTPCGSCKKRDTVVRCIYSPAAAEKVDLHSLNNRLIQVETFLALIAAGQTPHAFTSTYPFSHPSSFIGNSTHAGPSTSSGTSGTSQPSNFTSSFTSPNHHVHQHHHHHAVSGLSAFGVNTSIALSEQDVASIWLEGLDLGVSCHPSSSSSSTLHSFSYPQSNSNVGYIKLEPSPINVELGFRTLNHSGNANPVVIDVDKPPIYARPHTPSSPTLTSRASSMLKRSPPSTCFRSEFEFGFSHFRPREPQYQPPPQRRRSLAPTPTPILPPLSIYYPVTSIPPPDLSSAPIPGYSFHRRSSGPIDSPTSPPSTLFSSNPSNPYSIPLTRTPQSPQPPYPTPQVTPALLALLPPLVTCKRLLGSAREVRKVRPVALGPTFPSSSWNSTMGGGTATGWAAFERRCLGLLAGGGEWGEHDGNRGKERKYEQNRNERGREQERNAKEREWKEREEEKARRVRELFFAGLQEPPQEAVHPQHQRQLQHQSPSQSQDSDMCDIFIGGDPEGENMVKEREHHGESEEVIDTSLTFFATMCAMLAVGSSSLEFPARTPSHPDFSNALHESPSNSTAAGPTTPPMSSSPSSSITGTASAFEDPLFPSSAFFYGLSQQALGVWDTHVSSSGDGEREGEGNKDSEGMDYILACELGVGYLMSRMRLSADGREGEKDKKDRGGVIYVLVGKMVNVARAIGLGRADCNPSPAAREPSNQGFSRPSKKAADGRTNEWELEREEWRRMLWWEVMFWDMFTADALGHQPYISTSSYNTKLPACSESTSPPSPADQHQPQELDDAQDSEEEDRGDLESLTRSVDMTISSRNDGLRIQQPQDTLVDPAYHYLGLRYRLVKLVQMIKNRIAHPDCCCGYTLDQAAALEGDVRRWQSDDLIPTSFLAMDREQDPNFAVPKAQSCERILMANLLVLKIYSPFLRQTSSSPRTVMSSPATRASVTAAQAILRAAKSLRSITNASSVVLPVMLNFYPLDKLVFDAFIVCAYASLRVYYSSSFGADGSTLMEDVTSAVNILAEIGGSDSKRWAIVDALYERVVSRDVDVSAGYPNMSKRKHDQVDLEPGFEASGGYSSTNRAATGGNRAAMSGFDLNSNNNNDQLQHDGTMISQHQHSSPPELTSTTRSLTMAASSLGNSAEDKFRRTEQQEQKVTSALSSAERAAEQGNEQVQGKDKRRAKKPHPAVGVRARPGKDNLAVARLRAQATSNQPLLTCTPRPLPTAESVLAFQQQKQKLQSMSAASTSTTSSEAQSPAPASIHDLNRSRSSSLSHVQTEPTQHCHYTDRGDAESQVMEYPSAFSAPPRQEVNTHAIQRKPFGIGELNPRQPQQLSPNLSSFGPQMYNHGQSHAIYSQTQPTYDGINASSTDGMDYSSSFSNAHPPSSTSSPSFGSTSAGHPSTPTFGPRRAVPPVFGPQLPTAASSNVPTAYNPQFNGASYTGSSTSTSNFISHPQHPQNMSVSEMVTDQITKPHLQQQATMYDAKPMMENHSRHLLQHGHQEQQQQPMESSFYEDQDGSGQPHSLPAGMAAAPSWPPPSEQQEQPTQPPAQPFWRSDSSLRF